VSSGNQNGNASGGAGAVGCGCVLILMAVGLIIAIVWYTVQVLAYSIPVWGLGFLSAVASLILIASLGLLVARTAGGAGAGMTPRLHGNALSWHLDAHTVPWYARPGVAVWGSGLIGGAVAALTLRSMYEHGGLDSLQWRFLDETTAVDPMISAVLIGIASTVAYGYLLHWYGSEDLLEDLVPRLLRSTPPGSSALDGALNDLDAFRRRLSDLAGEIGLTYPLDHLEPAPPGASGTAALHSLERQIFALVNDARAEVAQLEKARDELADLCQLYGRAEAAALPTGSQTYLSHLEKLERAIGAFPRGARHTSRIWKSWSVP